MNDNEAKLNNELAKMSSLSKSLKDSSDRNEQMVYGRPKASYNGQIDTDLNTISNNIKNNMNGSLTNTLKTVSKDLEPHDAKNIKTYLESITESKEKELFQSLLSSMSGQIQLMHDLTLVTAYMPQLRDVAKIYVSDILSPDDMKKKLALHVQYNGEDLSSYNPELYKRVNNILSRQKFQNLLKRTTSSAITTGVGFVAKKTYSKLYKELMVRHSKENNNMSNLTTRKSAISENTITILKEDVDLDAAFINENFEGIGSKSAIDSMKDAIVDITNSIELCEGAMSFFDEEILEAEMEILTEAAASGKKNVPVNPGSIFNKIANVDSSSSDSVSKSNVVSNGHIEYEGDTIVEPKLSGMKTSLLDPKRLLELKVDDNIFGYYYIENKETEQMIRNPLSNNLTAAGLVNGKENIITDVYKKFGQVVIKKLNNKFIEKNADVKERLYDILKHTYDGKSTYKITFLEPNEVEKFELEGGESPFVNSILYAKLWMFVTMQHIMARVARGNDIRAYYVETSPEGAVSGQVMSAVNQLTRQHKSVLYYNSVPKMMNQASLFDDVVLPVPAGSTESPIKYDIIEGQRIDTPTDLLDMLEKIAVDSSGHPLQLLQSGNEADFARTYTMLSTKYLKGVVGYQQDLNPSLESLYKDIILANMDEDDEDRAIIQSLEVSFRSPVNLVLQNASEQIDNAANMADKIVELIIPSTNETPENVVGKLKRKIATDFITTVDLGAYTELYESLLIEEVVNKEKNTLASGEGDDIDMSDAGGDDNMDF